MGFLSNLINPGAAQQQSQEQARTEIYRSLMRYQAQLGAEVFGPVPKNTRREFFCLDERTWVWHEEWKDKAGQHVVTTRYDVRPGGVLKSQGNSSYQRLSYEEARNLYDAINVYYEKVRPELYRLQTMSV